MLKAKPKGSDGWQNFKICTIGISIGNPNCQGERLEAIVNWLNSTSNFEACMIDLSDSLNRYNIMLEDGIDEEAARAVAIEQGTQWLKDNQHILDKLNVPFKVTRWEKWLLNPKVSEYKAEFYKAFENDKTFREAVLADVENYHNRHDRSAWNVNNLGRMKYNIGYLIEELAVHSAIYDAGPVASIYPGEQQTSFRLVRNGSVENVPTGMQNSHFVRMNVYNTDAHKPINDDTPQDDGSDANGSVNGHGTTKAFAAAGTTAPRRAPAQPPAARPQQPARPGKGAGKGAASKAAVSMEGIPSMYLEMMGLVQPRFA